MNDFNDTKRPLGVPIRATEAAISSALVPLIDQLHETKLAIANGVESYFMESANAASAAMGAVIQFVTAALAECCAAVQDSQDEIEHHLRSRMAEVTMAREIAEAEESKLNRRLNEQAEKAKMKSARSSTKGIPAVAPQSRQPEVAHFTQGHDRPQSIVPFLADAGPFQRAPSAAELAGVVWLTGPDGESLELAHLPASLWDHDHPDRFFLSIHPTPLTWVQIPTYRVSGSQLEPVGPVSFNFGFVPTPTVLTAMGEAFGIPELATFHPDPGDTFARNAEVWGDPLVRAVWSTYDLPTPPLVPSSEAYRAAQDRTGSETTIGPAPTLQRQEGPKLANINGDEGSSTDGGTVFQAHLRGSEREDDPAGTLNEQFVAANGGGQGDPVQFGRAALGLDGAGILAAIVSCEALTPIYRYLGLDPRVMPGCGSYRDMIRALSARMRGSP